MQNECRKISPYHHDLMIMLIYLPYWNNSILKNVEIREPVNRSQKNGHVSRIGLNHLITYKWEQSKIIKVDPTVNSPDNVTSHSLLNITFI